MEEGDKQPKPMPAELALHQRSDEALLLEKQAELAALRLRLAEQEAELTRLRSQLHAFESRYFREVGVLYAELDDLEARIAEREVALYDSDAARQRAHDARQRANETQQAAAEQNAADEAGPQEPAPDLRKLFREVARRIHPDFARDESEQAYFTLLMARANQAYSRGDTEALQRLLADGTELDADLPSERSSAEVLRIARQIQHARRDLAVLETERHTLTTGEIAQLHADFEAARREHRDLLQELATSVRRDIEDATYRFQFVDRQIAAHGR